MYQGFLIELKINLPKIFLLFVENIPLFFLTELTIADIIVDCPHTHHEKNYGIDQLSILMVHSVKCFGGNATTLYVSRVLAKVFRNQEN